MGLFYFSNLYLMCPSFFPNQRINKRIAPMKKTTPPRLLSRPPARKETMMSRANLQKNIINKGNVIIRRINLISIEADSISQFSNKLKASKEA